MGDGILRRAHRTNGCDHRDTRYAQGCTVNVYDDEFAGGEIEPDAAVVVRELCACWSRISDEKLGGSCATRSDMISRDCRRVGETSDRMAARASRFADRLVGDEDRGRGVECESITDRVASHRSRDMLVFSRYANVCSYVCQ